jgi:hypothetical protein
MEDPVALLMIVLALTDFVLFLSLGFQLLLSPRRFFSKVFAARPGIDVWREKSVEASDSIFLYYAARIFAGGLLALFVLLTLRKMIAG